MTAVVAAPHRPARPLRLVPTAARPDPLPAGLAPTGTAPFEVGVVSTAVARSSAPPHLEVVPGGRTAVWHRRLAGLGRTLRSLLPALPRVSALVVVALLATTVAALVIAITAADPLPVTGAARPAPVTASATAAPVPVAPVPVVARRYVVQPGDTLWGIARSLQPAGDVRSLVDELARRLEGRTLQPGMQLSLDGLAAG
ncbi:MAG: LysM peptidoglycan-binding domain-containing protein [Acidimicrobiales bacterium]